LGHPPFCTLAMPATMGLMCHFNVEPFMKANFPPVGE
jgi:hypothetical protein